MVEEITYKELKELWGNTNGCGIRFFLEHDEIDEWKRQGNFKHLKNELIGLPNVKFICLQELHGCWYTFFTHSRKLSERILSIVRELRNDRHIHLVNAKTNLYITEHGINIRGTPQLCNLF